MNTYQKTFLIVAFAMIFAGGCAFNNRPAAEQKQKEAGGSPASTTQEIVTTSTEASIDTSDWKIYRNEELGFEVKVPPEFGNAMERISGDKNGYVNWSNPESSLSITAKYTTTSKQAVFDEFGMDMNSDHSFSVNELLGYRETQLFGKQKLTEGVYLYTDKVLVGRDGMYFYLSFSANSEDEVVVKNIFSKWERILLSFNAIPSIGSINTSNWKMYRNEELGFEVKVPEEWTKSLEDQNSPKSVSWNVSGGNFRILTVISTSTFQDVEEYLGVTFDNDQQITLNGLEGFRKIDPISIRRLTQDESLTYADQILVRKDNKYYLISFDAGSSVADEDVMRSSIAIKEAVIKTFSAF